MATLSSENIANSQKRERGKIAHTLPYNLTLQTHRERDSSVVQKSNMAAVVLKKFAAILVLGSICALISTKQQL